MNDIKYPPRDSAADFNTAIAVIENEAARIKEGIDDKQRDFGAAEKGSLQCDLTALYTVERRLRQLFEIAATIEENK